MVQEFLYENEWVDFEQERGALFQNHTLWQVPLYVVSRQQQWLPLWKVV